MCGAAAAIAGRGGWCHGELEGSPACDREALLLQRYDEADELDQAGAVPSTLIRDAMTPFAVSTRNAQLMFRFTRQHSVSTDGAASTPANHGDARSPAVVAAPAAKRGWRWLIVILLPGCGGRLALLLAAIVGRTSPSARLSFCCTPLYL